MKFSVQPNTIPVLCWLHWSADEFDSFAENTTRRHDTMDPAPCDAHQHGAGAPRKKRHAYTAQEKLDAINLFEETGSIRTTILLCFSNLAPAYYDSR